MEATGKYSHLTANFLHEQGYYVSVVNPVQIKYFMKSQLTRNKTDSIDAKMIAQFGELLKPAAWKPVRAEDAQLQALVNRLDVLENLSLQEKNRLGATPHPAVSDSITETLEFLAKQIKQLEEQIKLHVKRHTELREKIDLLKTIPGMGDKTAQRIVAFIGDVTRFTHPKQMTAYIGLNPKQRQSGSSIQGCAGISRIGNAYLRKILYMPALVAIKHNPIIKSFYTNLIKRGKPKKLAICAAMRKLVHLIYGILKSGKPFDPHWAV
jgi:transposase